MSNPVAKKMAALLDLAEGCSKHPSYRARKAPTSGCIECAHMWKSRQEIATLAAEHGIVIGYTAERVREVVYDVLEERIKEFRGPINAADVPAVVLDVMVRLRSNVGAHA